MIKRLPNLNAVKAFDAAARHQSFTLAADELSVTHAAISRHVRALELELDIVLFERKHRQVLLTTAGARYAKTIERALTSIAIDTGDLKANRETTRVVIEAESDLATLWLLPRMNDPDLQSMGIELDIRAQSGMAKTVLVEADLALTWGFLETRGYSSTPFLGFVAFPVCSPDWLSRQPATTSLHDLFPCCLIHERGTFWWDELLDNVDPGLLQDNRHLYFNRSYLSLESAARGTGLAVGDDLTCADMLKSERLVRPFGPDISGKAMYYISVPRKQPLSAATRIVRDWLLAQAADHMNWVKTWRTEQGIEVD